MDLDIYIYGSSYIYLEKKFMFVQFKVQKEIKFASSAKRKAGEHFTHCVMCDTQAWRKAQLLSVALKTSKTHSGKRSPEFVSLEKFLYR